MIDDVTPAFPHRPTEAASERGMSLRDYFAAAALTGYSSNPRVMERAIEDWDNGRGPRPTCIAEFLAGLAYEVADCMLAARKGGGQ